MQLLMIENFHFQDRYVSLCFTIDSSSALTNQFDNKYLLIIIYIDKIFNVVEYNLENAYVNAHLSLSMQMRMAGMKMSPWMLQSTTQMIMI